MLVIFDLDGVLADFAAGVARLFDLPPPGPERYGATLETTLGIPPGRMWSRIGELGARFWEELAATPEADALVALARERGAILVASSPSQDPASASGKMRWLQKRFGRRFRDFLITPRKELLAAPDRLLIDDSHGHVAAFTAAGGRSLLLPTWSNGGRPAADPITSLRTALEAP